MTASANNAALLPFAPTAAQIEAYNEHRGVYEALPAAAFKAGVLGYVDFTSSNPEGRGIDRGELQRRASLIAHIVLGNELGERARRNPNVVSLQRLLREEAPKVRAIAEAANAAAQAAVEARAEIIAADDARNEAACAAAETAAAEIIEAGGAEIALAAEPAPINAGGDATETTIEREPAAPVYTEIEAARAALEAAEGGDTVLVSAEVAAALEAAEAEELREALAVDDGGHPPGGYMAQEVLAAPAAEMHGAKEAASIWDADATAALARETVAVLAELYAPAETDAPAEAFEPAFATALDAAIDARLAPLQARLAALEAAAQAPAPVAAQAPLTPAAAPAPAPRMVRVQAPRAALGGVRFRPLPPRDSSPKYITLALSDDNAAVLDAMAERLGVSRVNLARYALDRLLISDGEEPIFAEGYTFGA